MSAHLQEHELLQMALEPEEAGVVYTLRSRVQFPLEDPYAPRGHRAEALAASLQPGGTPLVFPVDEMDGDQALHPWAAAARIHARDLGDQATTTTGGATTPTAEATPQPQPHAEAAAADEEEEPRPPQRGANRDSTTHHNKQRMLLTRWPTQTHDSPPHRT